VPHLHRLRVELPDQPGALAKVAATIAAQSANVVSVDIHELDGSAAVDEILVQALADWDPAGLAAALQEAGAGVLLSCQPGEGPVDPIVRALSWTTAMLAAGPQDSDLELARALVEACTYARAWICNIPEAVSLPAGRLALERGCAVVRRSDDLPASYSAGLPAAVWVLAVPDGRLDARLVAFLARPVSLRFTASEVARVEALMALHRQLTGATDGRGPALAR
jgi:ACT domain-containing protein